jgi:hypothetical protein
VAARPLRTKRGEVFNGSLVLPADWGNHW